MSAFISKLSLIDKETLQRGPLKVLQVNMGDICNQECTHCHVNAGPDGKRIMSKEVVDSILEFLAKKDGLILDITGGAPEMNPWFDYFITSARPMVSEIIVRSNLTVFFEQGKEYLPKFFKANKIHLICSLPCYLGENIDAQRGKGVFVKSIKALQILNEEGYGRDENLRLDLVYNPGGAVLPPEEKTLEAAYKKELKDRDNIDFDALIAITNAPINRFKEELERNDEYDTYMGLLKDNFNGSIAGNIMCRGLLSVGWDGKLYDCDFNQALGMAICENGLQQNIRDIDPADVTGREIVFGDHCFCCTAGSGSSCTGALEKEDRSGEVRDKTRDMVSNYYGEVLTSGEDLKTSACCNLDEVPGHIKEIVKHIEPEIVDKFYGCGSPIPLELSGRSVLDLGCGTGKDTYVISSLVGERGNVVGIDMTQKQLDVANKYLESQMKKFGFNEKNIRFLKGYIEDLKSSGIGDDSFDVVVSNCVVNLSSEKDRVLSEVYRVLKDGGEFFFSDVFADRRLPEGTKDDPVLLGECLGGALYWKDFERLASAAGFTDVRVYSKKPIVITDPDIKKKIGEAEFLSVTYRMFKLEDLEDACEDYGQIAEYIGGMSNSDEEFKLDSGHVFNKGEKVPVCGNSAMMLEKTRFKDYFRIAGDMSEHKGLFKCCGSNPVESTNEKHTGPVYGCC